MLTATLFAALGGTLWAFGALGKRIGVEGAPTDLKQMRSTCTIFVYTLTTSVPPIISFIEQVIFDRPMVVEVLNDPAWRGLIWKISGCGALSGLGGVFGTLAFAWSMGANSALISMVENGMYTVAGAALIAFAFGNAPRAIEYLAAAFILAGIAVAQCSSSSDEHAPSKKKKGSTVSLNPFHSDSESSQSDTDDNAERGVERGSNDSGRGESRGVEDSDSDGEESKESDRRQRLLAVLLACLAGIGWGFGPLGKTIGVRDAEKDRKGVQTVCTYLVYMASTCVVPCYNLLCADRQQRRATFNDPNFIKLMGGTALCGLISGCGGLASTYAFSLNPGHNAIISMVENGVYTVGGALLIAVTFRERPSMLQIVSAILVVVGITVSSAA